jgi:hypothetical protein
VVEGSRSATRLIQATRRRRRGRACPFLRPTSVRLSLVPFDPSDPTLKPPAMPSDVRLLGASRRLPVLHLRARVNRRPFRSLIVLLSLAAVAWRLASGLRPNPDDDADDALGSGSPSIWADLREWRRPAAGRPAPSPSPPPMEPRWAELGLQETAAGLVVLPALAPGDVLERHPVELLIEVGPVPLPLPSARALD